MIVPPDTQERIAFVAEGASIAAGDAADFVRERSELFLGGLAAVLALVVALLLLGGGDEAGTGDARGAAATAGTTDTAGATYVAERGYSLSLPAGWQERNAPKGAVFSAVSADGYAETTLWIERAPKLRFEDFLAQSRASLEKLGDDVRVVDRVRAPTLPAEIAVLAADVPLDGDVATQRVTLRAAGYYRYYLATSVAPGAAPESIADAELISGSFRPEAAASAAG